MRYVAVTEGDKTEAELRFGVQVNTWGVNELADAVHAASDADDRRARRRVRRPLRRRARAAAGRRPPRVACATAPRSSSACARSSRRAASARSRRASRTSARCGSCPASRCSGSWPTATASAPRATGRPPCSCASRTSWAPACPAARASWRTTPTTSCPATSSSSARTCSRSAPSLTTAEADASRSTRSASAARRTRCAWSSPPTPAPPSSSRSPTCATGSASSANVVENVAPPAPLPNLPVGRAVWKPAPDFATTAAAWLTAGAAHHTVMSTAVGVDVFRDFAEMSKTELLVIDEDTTLRRLRSARCAGTRPTTASRKACRSPQHAHHNCSTTTQQACDIRRPSTDAAGDRRSWTTPAPTVTKTTTSMTDTQ